MNVITIKSLVSFIKKLRDISNDIYKSNEERVYYRGEAKDYKENKLKPKVFRKNLETNEKIYDEHEEYRRTLQKRPNEFNRDMSKLDILCKMQHFGIPTKLLDYTVNPLVALFFACQESDDNGYVYLSMGNYGGNKNEIVAYDDYKMIYLSNLPTLTSDELAIYAKGVHFLNKDPEWRLNSIYKLDFFGTHEAYHKYDGDPYSMFSIFNANDSYNFSQIELKLSSNASKEFPLFTNLEIFPRDVLNSYFVKPLFANENIIKQQGLFYFNGLEETLIKPEYTFKIPRSSKNRILLELKRFAGIDKSILFSDMSSVSNSSQSGLLKELNKTKKR